MAAKDGVREQQFKYSDDAARTIAEAAGLSDPDEIEALVSEVTNKVQAYQALKIDLNQEPNWAETRAALEAVEKHITRLERALNRHSPHSLLVRGNHTTVPPSREQNHFRGRLIT